jgi:hypothetical protein
VFEETEFATAASGPRLAAALTDAAPGALPDDVLLDVITGWERLVRWASAMSLAAVAELEKRRNGPDAEFVVDEVALALRVSRTAAGARLLLACQLRRLPAVRAAMYAADLDVVKARIVAEAVQPLNDEAATSVERRVLARAAEQTPGQLRAACARAVHNADPAAASRRHADAVRGRGVRIIPLGDGIAELALRHSADATWQRIFTDPLTGRLAHVDRGAYTPPAALAEHVRTRDQTCRFPGCRRAARWCDLDHRVPYPHGPTCACNLCCLCRHHHRLNSTLTGGSRAPTMTRSSGRLPWGAGTSPSHHPSWIHPNS